MLARLRATSECQTYHGLLPPGNRCRDAACWWWMHSRLSAGCGGGPYLTLRGRRVATWHGG